MYFLRLHCDFANKSAYERACFPFLELNTDSVVHKADNL